MTTPATDDFPDGITTTYVYENHNLTTIIDHYGNPVLWNTYDADDHVIHQESADGRSFDFTYDHLGQVTTIVDSRGIKTEKIYNTFERLAS